MGAPQVRQERIKVPLWAVITGWLARGVGRGLWWLIRQPLLWVLAAAGWAGWWLADGLGTVSAVSIGVCCSLGLVAWRVLLPGSFFRLLAWPVRSWWRRWFVYGRQWGGVMSNLKLVHKRLGAEHHELPALVRVRSTSTVDKVRVRMLPAQMLADFAKHADRLAATFEALDCRVRSIPRRTWYGRKTDVPSRVLELWFVVRDPLTDVVPPFDVPAKPNLKALPVALQEDGLPWLLRLLATHVLIVGATGAGKGSVLWSILRALGNGIRTGLVELWVIDPKGGMEFAAGERLFTRFCYGDTKATDEAADDGKSDGGKRRAYELAYAEFLEELVERMRERQARLRGWLRTHRPAPGDPLIVTVIDELASLTAYVTDREAKKRIEAALNLLLSQGRAVGVVVIAALQDPRKEVLPARGLFPTRIALRMNEADEVDLVLSDGARERGARCDQIPESLPGVGFVVIDGRAEPARLRFSYVADEHIGTVAALYAPGAIEPAELTTDAEPAGLRLVGRDRFARRRNLNEQSESSDYSDDREAA